MTFQPSSSRAARRLGLGAAAAALALLGGCVVAPTDPYYGDNGYYDSGPAYYGPPVWFGVGWSSSYGGHRNWHRPSPPRYGGGRPGGGDSRPGGRPSGGRGGGGGRGSGPRR